MPLPKYQKILIPFLQTLTDGQPHNMKHDTMPRIREHFSLSDEELQERLPSGHHVFSNRAWWARTYLKKMGHIDYPSGGFSQITEAGRAALEQYSEGMSNADVNRVIAEQEGQTPPETQTTYEDLSPEEQIIAAHREYRNGIENELLATIVNASPAFFEHLVVDIMVKMGYGGAHEDAGRAVGQTNDGGIDGIIKDDVLGLETIYLQAKRWQGSVGREEVQKFAGALSGRNSQKGVFITTSTFSSGAREYVKTVAHSIVLIDGTTLARYMYDYGLGVNLRTTLDIKAIELEYFEQSQ